MLKKYYNVSVKSHFILHLNLEKDERNNTKIFVSVKAHFILHFNNLNIHSVIFTISFSKVSFYTSLEHLLKSHVDISMSFSKVSFYTSLEHQPFTPIQLFWKVSVKSHFILHLNKNCNWTYSIIMFQ